MNLAGRRRWWALYALGVLLTIGALGWVSVAVLELGRAERAALREQDRQEALRLALWRIDSWLGPHLARETARVPGEYQAYSPQPLAYTKVLNRIEPGEVLVPSPLLEFESPWIRVHFEVDAAGDWSSPQVPRSNDLDLAEATGCLDPTSFEARRAALDELRSALGEGVLARRLARAEERFARLLRLPKGADDGIGPLDPERETEKGVGEVEELRNVRERGWRADMAQQAQAPAPQVVAPASDLLEAHPDGAGAGDAPSSSPLVPLWIARVGAPPLLCFARRVHTRGQARVQGFLADWPHLRASLLERVADLLPEAELQPAEDLLSDAGVGEAGGRWLATLPATLRPGELPEAPGPGWSPAETSLLVGWLVALAALAVLGLGLHSSIRFGLQRSRFASAVSHELRTPLTTFRLYTDLLVDGRLPEERRQESLRTLQLEAERLSALVENVHGYARLEQGRAGLARRPTRAVELLERVAGPLSARVDQAGLEWRPPTLPEERLELETDPEAVAQVLFILVDNACKHGRGESGGAVGLELAAPAGALELRVRDEGPGVPAGVRRNIFRAFDRGELEGAQGGPGIGLGLALARGLARDLGGDLVLEEPGPSGGACFCLSLPRGRIAP